MSRQRSKSRQRSRSKTIIVPTKSIPKHEPLLKIKQEYKSTPKIYFLSDLTQRLNYNENAESLKKAHLDLHQGQRKLFLTELYFLTMYAELSKHILYVGAAPGDHISIFSILFPNHTFYCYDLTPFKINQPIE